MDYLEIAGTAVGLVYLYLEYKANVWLWLAGVVMPVIYIFVYYDAGLYADMGISVYYLVASLYGAVCWLSHRNQPVENSGGTEDSAGIGRTPRQLIPLLVFVCVVCSLLIGWILKTFTDSTVPWADGVTTALSVVAMWMLAEKYVEQWLVWILADIGCALLYIYKELWFTAGLYALYAIIAVAGYRKWLRMIKNGTETVDI